MATLFLAAMLLTNGAVAHEIKVATWNIEHLRDSIGEGPNPRDQAARWIKPYTFEQVIYQEDETLEEKLSDHCPIAVVIDTR